MCVNCLCLYICRYYLKCLFVCVVYIDVVVTMYIKRIILIYNFYYEYFWWNLTFLKIMKQNKKKYEIWHLSLLLLLNLSHTIMCVWWGKFIGLLTPIWHKALNVSRYKGVLVWIVNSTWNQPVLSNEGTVFCSRKQLEPLMGCSNALQTGNPLITS